MKKLNRVIWGIVLAAVGVLFALNALEITKIDIFFDGWWTLFILIPSFVGLFTEREKTGNIIGILVGAFLLLCSRDILDFSMLWKLLLPAIIFLIGIKMVFGALFEKKPASLPATPENGPVIASAIFGGRDLNYNGQVFEGGNVTAIFGGVDCNLKNAIIEKDCFIRATAIFGGIDILVPANVNVVVSSVSIFGGISNETPVQPDVPTIYMKGFCLFGGVDIK
jgi:predicted membrane protein